MRPFSLVRRVGLVIGAAVVAALLPVLPAVAGTPISWTYETMAVGTVPGDCTVPSGRASELVSADRAFTGTHSLLLADSNPGALPVLNCTATGTTGMSLTFEVYPAALAHGFMVDMVGTTTASSTDAVVFHLLFRADGGVQAYDGTRWLPLAAAGTLPLGQWSKVQVGTVSNNRMLYASVNGTFRGTGTPWGVNPVTAIHSFQFAGYGTNVGGDKVYFDDVTAADTLSAPPAGAQTLFQPGTRTQIGSQASPPAQMPNTAVQVPNGSGKRIIANYPEHADNSSSGGNQLVYSDDNGASWQSFQTHNPYPSLASYTITKLRNGNLMALSYHQYSYSALASNQDIIKIATSTDNGNSWTLKDGIFSAPVTLGSPGTCEVGGGCKGLVDVHNLVETADGTLYQSAYGTYPGDTKSRQVLLVSTDSGATWTQRASVAYNPSLSTDSAYEGFDEGVFDVAANGTMRVVMRTGSYLPMYTATSTDNGQSWTTPTQIHSADGATVSSVYPTLQRATDGSLVMLVGRPGYSLLRSTDDGASWSRPQWIDYQDSANGYLVPLASNTFMVFGDTGANWQSPALHSVWSQQVTMTP